MVVPRQEGSHFQLPCPLGQQPLLGAPMGSLTLVGLQKKPRLRPRLHEALPTPASPSPKTGNSQRQDFVWVRIAHPNLLCYFFFLRFIYYLF